MDKGKTSRESAGRPPHEAARHQAAGHQAADKAPHDPADLARAMADPMALGRILTDVSQKAQPLLREFMEKYEFRSAEMVKDPLNLRNAYMDFINHLLADPERLVQAQMNFWWQWMQLCHESTRRFLTGEGQSLYKPEKGDRRFKAPEWQESAVFDFIKQSYLLTSQWLQDLVQETDGLDDDTRAKVDFYTRQFVQALAPSNFVFTNPEVLRETMNSGGENLLRGLRNLLEDLERGGGELNIRTVDEKAFRLGENIAVTPGKVVFQNDLIQLIQYEPTTEKVHRTPLLIVPPWINKYYILDLRPDNSFVSWAVSQGHTVFIISWVNPDARLAKKRFEDYMQEGVFGALDVIRDITGEESANTLGYCLGGTLLSCALAWLSANGQADRIASATFLTTLVDFKDAGELKMFMDASQLEHLDDEMSEKGYLPADYLKRAFSLLRANDLIWSFVVNNYLMGREPFPFDLLYWNEDATNMPAAMHSFYMRECYHENRLPVPGGATLAGAPIDMRKVKTPAYFLSAREDHIAPWIATYATTQLFQGPCTFVLAASGHVAGVINPPAAGKYSYATAPVEPDRSAWLKKAEETQGSWWPHWHQWIGGHSGGMIPARKPGSDRHKPIEDAPGSYVKMKAD